MTDKHYDVGIFGVWCGCNYGSVATYYALHQVFKDLGKSVLMIDKPKAEENDFELSMTHSRRFANEHYEISPSLRAEDFYKLNDMCDCFVIGSDQVWNYGISRHTGHLMYLDFVSDEKMKISYASSLGHGVDFAPHEERIAIAKLLSRFDGISVRERSGVELLDECYGINAVQVLDPVFLPDPKLYLELADKCTDKQSVPFLATYILDPTPEKRQAILHVAQKLGGLKVINLLDGLPWKFQNNRELMNLPNCVENLQVEGWLYYISKCEFLITDSCHGASFAIIFRRPFVAISNKSRGHTRFVSLLENFGLSDRLITDPLALLDNELLIKEYDIESVSNRMAAKKKFSLSWLNNILGSEKKSSSELLAKNVICDISKLKSIDERYDLFSMEKPYEFNFDGSVWQSYVILGYTTLIPIDISPASGKYAYHLFDTSTLSKSKIDEGKSYQLSLDIKYHTTSEYINFHLYCSKTNKLQIIRRYKTVHKSMNRWIQLTIDLIPDSGSYDSLMIGAMQICGENRFIAFRNICISES